MACVIRLSCLHLMTGTALSGLAKTQLILLEFEYMVINDNKSVSKI
ncbi:Uncharacterised protein [Grimontia hollisae]|nr:Uncharacterised protein [Grimontia hollisae]STQ77067.1 Uncharacterised protein [Grimontia hollisae]